MYRLEVHTSSRYTFYFSAICRYFSFYAFAHSHILLSQCSPFAYQNCWLISMSVNSLYSPITSRILRGILQSHILMKRSTPSKIYTIPLLSFSASDYRISQMLSCHVGKRLSFSPFVSVFLSTTASVSNTDCPIHTSICHFHLLFSSSSQGIHQLPWWSPAHWPR